MELIAIFVEVSGLLTYLNGVASLDEKKRILMGETESLNARMQDIQTEISSTRVPRGMKQKRDDALCDWMTEGQKLVGEAQRLLRQVGRWRCGFLVDVCKLVDALRVHHKNGGVLLDQTLSDARGLCHGLHIPVKQLVGRVASKSLDQLKFLLEGDEAGRIAIHGIEGIGKTFLMKHLHNYALDRFDYVFWVSCPDEFTIKRVQDAVAAVVKCDLASDDDSNVRAIKLRQKLAGLGRFALFLDGVTGVHEADISVDRIGIPVPPEGSECKLILSTSSTLVCRMLKCFVTVKVERLPGEEAWQLFMHEARIVKGSVSSLVGMPRLLADTCNGVPRMIVNVATCMCGKDDPHEWRYALFQSGCLGTKNKLTSNDFQT